MNSISKIPDRIKKEIYIQECARIMDISEQVLFSSLAQLDNKNKKESTPNYNKDPRAFDVIKNEEPPQKVDIQYVLERKIIELLLLYGNRTEDFEDLILKENEKGDLELEPVKHQVKVFEKIFWIYRKMKWSFLMIDLKSFTLKL